MGLKNVIGNFENKKLLEYHIRKEIKKKNVTEEYNMSLDFYIVDEGKASGKEFELFSKNITHNVTPMWRKAEIFDELYESHGKQPKEIVEQLEQGLFMMQIHSEEYKLLNPANGWGNYEYAIQFLSNVIEACKLYPEAKIKIWK